jgi:hypothetical protein
LKPLTKRQAYLRRQQKVAEREAAAERRAMMRDVRVYRDRHVGADGHEFFSVNIVYGDGGLQFGPYSKGEAARQVLEVRAAYARETA